MKRKLLYALLGLATIALGVLFIVEYATNEDKSLHILKFVPVVIGACFLIYGLIQVLQQKKNLNSKAILGIIMMVIGAGGIVIPFIKPIFPLYVIAILLILLSDLRFYKKPEGIFEILLPSLMQASGIMLLTNPNISGLFYVLGGILIVEGIIEIYYAFSKEHIKVKTELTAKMDIVEEEKPVLNNVEEVKELENTLEGIEEKKEDL